MTALAIVVYFICGYITWKAMVRFDPTRAFRTRNSSISFRGNGYYTIEDIAERNFDTGDIYVTAEMPWVCLFLFPLAVMIIISDVLATRSKTSIGNRIELAREQLDDLKQLEKEL